MEYLKKKLSKKKISESDANADAQSQPPTSDPQQLHKPNLDAPAPKGILKNKHDAAKYTNTNALPTSNDIDESLRNAQKNSSLNQSLGASAAASPQNEEVKESVLSDPMISTTNPSEKQKDLRWDEANLEKNEEEKVPRMKIDEPPTPYAERPAELEYGDEEEVILDEDPMAMSNDLDIDSNEAELVHTEKTLDQQQQSLLLGDDAFRQKMVNDAMNRRQGNDDNASQNSNKRKVPRSAWEEDDNDSTPTLSGSGSTSSPDDEEQRAKKRKFENKRKAHYNEFHAIKAWKAKQAALAASENNDAQ